MNESEDPKSTRDISCVSGMVSDVTRIMRASGVVMEALRVMGRLWCTISCWQPASMALVGHKGCGGGACCMGQWWVSQDGGCMWGTQCMAAGCLGGTAAHMGKGCGGGGVGAGGAGRGETKSQKPGMVVAAPESWLLMPAALVLMKQWVYLCHP